MPLLGHFSQKMAQNGLKMRFFEDCRKSSHRISMKLGMKLGHYKVHLWAVVVILGKICKLVILGLFVPKTRKVAKIPKFQGPTFQFFLKIGMRMSIDKQKIKLYINSFDSKCIL